MNDSQTLPRTRRKVGPGRRIDTVGRPSVPARLVWCPSHRTSETPRSGPEEPDPGQDGDAGTARCTQARGRTVARRSASAPEARERARWPRGPRRRGDPGGRRWPPTSKIGSRRPDRNRRESKLPPPTPSPEPDPMWSSMRTGDGASSATTPRSSDGDHPTVAPVLGASEAERECGCDHHTLEDAADLGDDLRPRSGSPASMTILADAAGPVGCRSDSPGRLEPDDFASGPAARRPYDSSEADRVPLKMIRARRRSGDPQHPRPPGPRPDR